MKIISFFESIHTLSEQAREALLDIMQTKRYAKNDIIQDIGSSCKTVFFVKTGCARIFYYKDGNDITEHFAFEN
ncbi:MAG: hypothetical protein LAT54_06545 [Cryomorphaceae bacterium]|nr:hypothetical protein [Cryomorphaceae bacterium]